MERSTHLLSGRMLQVVRLGIPVMLAMLFVLIVLGASADGTPAIASSPAQAEAAVLNSGNVITIGVATALSGPVSFLGWPQANAVQLAIDQVNAAGGVEIGGTFYSLTVVTADDECNPAQAAAAANTLLNAGAVAVVGHACSGPSMAAQSIYNAAGVPMVSPSASAILLTEQGYTTTFRVAPKDDAEAVLMATYFRQSLKMDAVALVEWNGYVWSTDAFSNTFTSLGGSITSRHGVSSTNDYTTTLTAIQAENPDSVFYADFDANNAGFLSSVAHNLGLNIIGWEADGNEAALGDYAAAAGAAAEGDYAGLNPRRTRDMPGYNALNEAYLAAGFPNNGDEAGVWGAFAYDAVKIIVNAIDQADSTNPADIRGAIAATTNYQGVVGTYQGFDAKGDVVPQWSWLEKFQNGQWVTAYPYNLFLPLVLNDFQ